MTPKYFLTASGLIFLAIGILGLVGGIIGPTPGDSLFGSVWYFNKAEVWAHIVFGILNAVFALALYDKVQKIYIALFGVFLIGLGIYNLFGSYEFLGAHFEHPVDTFFRLIFGVWALVAAAKVNEYKPSENNVVQR